MKWKQVCTGLALSSFIMAVFYICVVTFSQVYSQGFSFLFHPSVLFELVVLLVVISLWLGVFYFTLGLFLVCLVQDTRFDQWWYYLASAAVGSAIIYTLLASPSGFDSRSIMYGFIGGVAGLVYCAVMWLLNKKRL